MPTYTMKNKQTGEIQDMRLSFAERDEILAAGEWEQTLNTPNFVSTVRSPLRQAGSGWQDHLKRVKKGAGRNSTIKD